MSEIWRVYSTFASKDEAFSMATKLLEKELIACANIFGNIQSVYRWEGRVVNSTEIVFIAKTQVACVDKVVNFIKDNHSYQLPCITASPVTKTHPPFLQWVIDETSPA